MLTGESRFHISTPPGDWTWAPHDGKLTVDPLDQWECVWMQWDCRLSIGLPLSSRLCRWDTKAVWDQVGLLARRPSYGSGRSPPTRPKWSITSGSPMLQDNAHRRIPVLHMYPPGDWTRALMTGSKRVTHRTSETVYECSKIAGSAQYIDIWVYFYIGEVQYQSTPRLNTCSCVYKD